MRQDVNPSKKKNGKEENADKNDFCRNAFCGHIGHELDIYL